MRTTTEKREAKLHFRRIVNFLNLCVSTSSSSTAADAAGWMLDSSMASSPAGMDVLKWAFRVVGEDAGTLPPAPDLRSALASGELLCQLANALWPKAIPTFNRPARTAFHKAQNIQFFLQGASTGFSCPKSQEAWRFFIWCG